MDDGGAAVVRGSEPCGAAAVLRMRGVVDAKQKTQKKKRPNGRTQNFPFFYKIYFVLDIEIFPVGPHKK